MKINDFVAPLLLFVLSAWMEIERRLAQNHVLLRNSTYSPTSQRNLESAMRWHKSRSALATASSKLTERHALTGMLAVLVYRRHRRRHSTSISRAHAVTVVSEAARADKLLAGWQGAIARGKLQPVLGLDAE